MNRFLLLLCVCALSGLQAQVPDSPAPARSQPAPAAAPASSASSDAAPASSGGGARPAGSSFLGKDLPVFNPGNEILTWDGKNWNVTNQRLFAARFEKYLNAPEETATNDLQYQALIRTILNKLAPENDNMNATVDAWRLLCQASKYPIDARLCDALADGVYSVWLAKREQDRLAMANQEFERQRALAIDELERQRRQNEWNAQVSSREKLISTAPTNKKGGSTSQATEAAPYIQRLVEINARLAAYKAKQELTKETVAATNIAKREISEVQVRIEFQALILQFFLQRRFQHVVIATRFYRHLFNDGSTGVGNSHVSSASSKENKTKVRSNDKGMDELYFKATGMPLTVGVIDSLANEAMRDVREGVDAYIFLLKKNELESASKRLSEAFLIGEYMPELRTLPREQKRKALLLTQKGNRLISAIDVRDYTLAETLVNEIEAIAKDFDGAQPRAAIETARTVSALHLAKAKNAAVSGDRATLETELREATTIWPRNPALAEISGMIFSHADLQGKAIADLEQLISQHNYRQIYDDKLRFIAATAVYPERQEQLKKVLETMQQIETAITRASEYAKRGDHFGAWEDVERASRQFPDDTKLNQLRANLTTEASDFVRCIRTAQQLEEKGQIGSGLAWYLKAQKQYPPSELAKQGIDRLVQKLVPAQ